MSLRTKLLVGLGLPTLITFLILIGLNYRAASNDALTEVSRFVTQLGARKAAEVSGQFAVMEPAPQMLAEILGSTQPKTDEEVFSWLELSIAINPYAFGSAAGYEKGAFDPARPLFCPYVTKGGDRTYLDPDHGTYDYTADEAVTPWYVIPRRTGKPYWTDPFYDINTWMCCYAVPFFREGRFAGVATVDIATTGVNQILKDGQVDLDGFAPGGYFFMINPNGAITGHPDEKLIHEGVNLIDLNLAVAGDDELKEPWSELKDLMAEEESFTLRLRNTLDDQGRSWKWVGFNRVDATGWYLGVVVDEKAALAPAKTKLVKDVGVIVLLMVILVLAMLVPVSRLIRQLSAMAEALKSQFQRLDLAYRHIEASSRNLGEVASRQSEQVDVSNEVLNRLKDISQANHDNARQGLDIGRRTSDQIQGGSEAVMRMGQAMESIAEASTRIQSILKTIEDIAFQTNLLALNAAVEAARAGEAGSGFAVVADEVRNLAQRSAEAVRNTDELIAVTLERIKNGELISADLEASFQTISESGQSTIEAIRRIAESIDDNSGQMEQLGRSSADLNSAAGETAEAAGAISSEALDLGRQAQELNMVISGLENLIDHGRSQIMVRPPLTPIPERRLIM